jgi:hypothetical protein
MIDVRALAEIFSLEGAAWAMFLVLSLFVARMWNGSPAMFQQWIAYKRAKAEEKASDWMRLRDHCSFLMDAEERCRAELNEVKSRLATVEGYLAGQGRASQEAAGIIALERQARNEKPEKPNG